MAPFIVGLGIAPTVGIGDPAGFPKTEVRVPFALAPSDPVFVTVVLALFDSCMRN